MNTCRLCKGIGEPLFKYGTRHYVHADCGFKRWGVEFLEKLHGWQIKRLPFRIVDQFNMVEECRRYLVKLELRADQRPHERMTP